MTKFAKNCQAFSCLKQNFLKLKLIRLSLHSVLYLLLSEFIDQVQYCNYLALKIGFQTEQ
jgi:hypothetical protein